MSISPRTDDVGGHIGRFNDLAVHEARTHLESCLAVPRWVDKVLEGRPYPSRRALLDRAEAVAHTLSVEEVDAALARHPRVGEQAGEGHDAEFSTREQAGIDHTDAAAAKALRVGNADYARRFGRVFLIRAAGRTSAGVLSELRRRLHNSAEVELAEVVAQLSEIALLRLEQLIPPSCPESHAISREN